jgi:hydroxyacylglutathione hydrolase
MRRVRVTTFPVRPLGCNCSIIADEAAGQAIVVDPGGDFEKIRDFLSAQSLTVAAIVHTHTHFDHVGATAALQEWTGAAARIHEEDRFLYDMLPLQAAMFGMPPVRTCDVQGDLVDGLSLAAGSIELGVLHTPGHTPGSVCFVARTGSEGLVFSGDTLFRRGIGRTDLWGGDADALRRSLHERLMVLPDDMQVVPGHGPATTVGDERRHNPFLAR